MRRVSVVGSSGSGKSTAGRALASRLGVEFVELDAIFHQHGWTDLPLEDFRARVGEHAAADAWVIDGNYSGVRDLVWDRADTVVWLDLSRLTVVWRLIRRTLRRAITREVLWNGNREPLTNFYRWDPMKNVIRWSWVKHGEYRQQYQSAMSDPRLTSIHFVRLGSVREISEFLNAD
jgi:adenylate kinase family enzyme